MLKCDISRDNGKPEHIIAGNLVSRFCGDQHPKALQKYVLHSRGVKQLERGSEDTVKDEPRTKEKEKEEQKETVQKMRRKEK